MAEQNGSGDSSVYEGRLRGVDVLPEDHRKLVTAGDWDGITSRTRDAVELAAQIDGRGVSTGSTSKEGNNR